MNSKSPPNIGDPGASSFMSENALVGIIVGSISSVILVLLIVACICYLKYRNRLQEGQIRILTSVASVERIQNMRESIQLRTR